VFPILTLITVRLGLLFLVSAHRHPNRMKSHILVVEREDSGTEGADVVAPEGGR